LFIATFSSGGQDASRSGSAAGCQRTTYGGPGPRGRPAEAVAGGVLALRLPLLPLPLSGDIDAGS
jgi:hypothetical protein